jgi:hypothetical protein
MADLFKNKTESREWFQNVFGFEEPEGFEAARAMFELVGPLHETVLVSKPPDGPPRRFYVGDFETPSLSDLRGRIHAEVSDQGSLQFKHVVGNIVDVFKSPKFAQAVIQAASQFNCLEMPNPYTTPEDGVTGYYADETQGPVCAMMCPAGTVFRNYFVNGTGQPRDKQLDTLVDVAKVLAPGADNPYWYMQNGYCFPWDQDAMEELNDRLKQERGLVEAAMGALRVGVHWSTEVVGGQRVCQVYCAALPLAYTAKKLRDVMHQLAYVVLCATYEATFAVAAILAQQRRARVKLVVLSSTRHDRLARKTST